MELTKEQKQAINKLRKSLKEAEKVGIRLCGMDGTLLYANLESIAEITPERVGYDGNYCPVAVANLQIKDSDGVGHLVDGGIYTDSGGW